MPRMIDAPNSNRLVKLLLIGDGKLGKTWYAGMAAMGGFDVLYMDGDVGSQTLSQLPREAQEHIYLLDVCDTLLDGRKDAKFWDTIHSFANAVDFRWNDDAQREATRNDINSTIWGIKPGRLDASTVLVLDSWTAMCESIMTKAAQVHGVDLADASTAEMRPVYQAAGLKATQILQLIRSMPCHIIVLAHPDEYSHMSKPDGVKVRNLNEKDLTVDWTKMIPRSTSKPHGLQMSKYFSDIGWMETNATGSQRFINFKLSSERVSGGHFTDRKDPATDYSFANLVKLLGGNLPESRNTDHWLTIIPPTEVDSTDVVAPVLDGTKPTLLKTTGIAGLGFGKK